MINYLLIEPCAPSGTGGGRTPVKGGVVRMYCKNCGEFLPDYAIYCFRCGAIVDPKDVPDVPRRHRSTPAERRKRSKRPGVDSLSDRRGPRASRQQSGRRERASSPTAVADPPRQKSRLKTAPRRRGLTPLPILIVLGLIAIVASFVLFGGPASTEPVPVLSDNGSGIYGIDLEDDSARSNYTVIKGNNEDVYTLMIYLVGSDSESKQGLAAADLEEMLNATVGGKLNIVLQTGGTSTWTRKDMSGTGVCRWLIRDGKLKQLEQVEDTSMLTSDSLGSFLQYAAQNYPADRYSLLFWGHGGGSVYGFGQEELYKTDTLYLPDIASALAGAGIKFDFVGFDAPLMGSLETAYMLEPYADYLIASEDTEPASGWYYTDWLTWLSDNTSCDTVELGVQIVDDYVSHNGKDGTLSITSLAQISRVYKLLGDYADSLSTALVDGSFDVLSATRADCRYFGDDPSYDLIDLADFVDRSAADGSGFEGGSELKTALNSAVKYRSNCSVAGTNGLSLYFPYHDLSVYEYAKSYCSSFGFGGTTYQFFDQFASVLAKGQASNNSVRTLKAVMTGTSSTSTPKRYTSASWYDASAAEYGSGEPVDFAGLSMVWSDASKNYILPLFREDEDLLTGEAVQFLQDTGEGYVNLGCAWAWQTDADGNLALSFDGTWTALDDEIVPYYTLGVQEEEDGSVVETGYIPAQLNETANIQILVRWDGETGTVLGYRTAGTGTGLSARDVLSKGYSQLKTGDRLTFLCDYYTYDGSYVEGYHLGAVTVGDAAPAVSQKALDTGVEACSVLTDLYGNQSWSNPVALSSEADQTE